jgi:hypothetical protein
MSTRKQIDRAVRRAEKRDRKRKTKMAVSGKSVFTLKRLMNQRGRR